MAVRVPSVVREAWGDAVMVEVVPWLQEMIREYGVPRDEYREGAVAAGDSGARRF